MSKKLTYLIIHCTATPEGREVTSDEIRKWHTSPPPKGRGWKQVGYSDMIHLDGTLENLVPYNNDDIVDAFTQGINRMMYYRASIKKQYDIVEGGTYRMCELKLKGLKYHEIRRLAQEGKIVLK